MSDYSITGNIQEEIKYKVTVWLVTGDGRIFVKNIPKDIPFIETEHMTLECNHIREVFNESIDLWGIFLAESDLDKIFAEVVQTSDGLVKEIVYILNMDLTPFQMSRIALKKEGEFMQLDQVEKFLKGFKKTEHFYYFFYKFLTSLEDRLTIKIKS